MPNKWLKEHFKREPDAKQLEKKTKYLLIFILFTLNLGKLESENELFPCEDFPKGSRIAVHEAGVFGLETIVRLDEKKYVRVVAWVDKNYDINCKRNMKGKRMIDLKRYIQKDKKYYIYGIKGLGTYCVDIITKEYGNDIIQGFIETEPMEKVWCQKPVIALKDVKYIQGNFYIILASANYYAEMMSNLIKENIAIERIVVLKDIYPYFKGLMSFGDNRIEKICFWPPIGKGDLDVQKKIAWFLPERASISIWCDQFSECNFGHNVVVEELRDRDKIFDRVDAIYLWKIESSQKHVEKFLEKVYVVDPEFWLYVETLNYNRLYYKTFTSEEKEKFNTLSRERFYQIKLECSAGRANIFCSGPSIDEAYDLDVRGHLNIISNSMVKNVSLMDKINPGILVFTDVNFYLSPHQYCRKFFEDVMRAVQKYNMYIVVYDWEIPLIWYHYPELRDKLIGIPGDAKEFVFPDYENFCVKQTANILTELMIPIASALCDQIGIAGCTGRNPQESYYWKHNSDTQYLDLMQSVFDMYPSVFRDQKYGNYYDRHCDIVKEILEYGEGLGKEYINLTSSYIPALRERTAETLQNRE